MFNLVDPQISRHLHVGGRKSDTDLLHWKTSESAQYASNPEDSSGVLMPSEHDCAHGGLAQSQPKIDQLHQLISFCACELIQYLWDLRLAETFQTHQQLRQSFSLCQTGFDQHASVSVRANIQPEDQQPVNLSLGYECVGCASSCRYVSAQTSAATEVVRCLGENAM